MKSLFETESLTEIKNRINTLSPKNERKWGKMEVDQMLNHCQHPLNVSLGKGNIKKQF